MKAVSLLSIPLVLMSCAGPHRPDMAAALYPVSVAHEGTACRIVADGRAIVTDDPAGVIRAEVPAGRAVLVQVDRERTSYRCIGGTIFALQRAGVRDFAFDPP